MYNTKTTKVWTVVNGEKVQKEVQDMRTAEQTVKRVYDNMSFADLVRTYEKEAQDMSTKAFSEVLQQLAYACVICVLKKIYEKSGNKLMLNVMQDIIHDTNTVKQLLHCIDTATEYRYNDNGDRYIEVIDKNTYKSIPKLLNNSLDIDLINTAVITILSETKKTDTSWVCFMELKYPVRRLKKKVYIQAVDSVNGYETVYTSPIQEVFKAIRREIQNSGSIQSASSKYVYISDTIKDNETETETEVFKRLPKYSSIAYEVTDINGKVTAITADNETVENVETLVSQMNLTAKQATVLKLRLSGYGIKAISTYLGVNTKTVHDSLKYIRKKAIAIGLTPNNNK